MKIPKGYILIKQTEYDSMLKTISQLMIRVVELEEQNIKLLKRIEELETQKNKDSRNSSKPPSSDGLKKTIKNNREKSKRNQGAQPGHKGSGLSLMKEIDKTVSHSVEGNCDCGASLKQQPTVKVEQRQVIDFPEKLIEVTEHLVEVKACGCGKIHKAVCDYPARVQYGEKVKTFLVYCNQYQQIPFERLQHFVHDMFGLSISDGLIQSSVEQCYQVLENSERQIKEGLMREEVIHNDETGIRCEGKTGWIHNASSTNFTLLHYHSKRGHEAIDAIGILPFYTGISIHDRWSSYDKYPCLHGLCNAHLLRDLKFMHEEMNREWAEKIKCILQKSNQRKKEGRLTAHFITRVKNDIKAIVRKALRMEPKEKNAERKRGRKAKSKPIRLLEVFRDRAHQILLFLEKEEVPFDNNLAERDLRMIKLKQKISGCFRTKKGVDFFCRIRSYIATVKKQANNIMDAITQAMLGKPIDLLIRTEQ